MQNNVASCDPLISVECSLASIGLLLCSLFSAAGLLWKYHNVRSLLIIRTLTEFSTEMVHFYFSIALFWLAAVLVHVNRITHAPP